VEDDYDVLIFRFKPASQRSSGPISLDFAGPTEWVSGGIPERGPFDVLGI
jgi:hypothetical protein